MRDDNQKELFNLFRDNQHKLDQKPSNQAWRRLESRLDAHQNRTRISFVRHLSMAAAIDTEILCYYYTTLNKGLS